MKGYFTESANIIGTESRTSSPLRIPRDKTTYMHPELNNLFPCGEGAGYAGGIVSAAMDGQRIAKAIAIKKKKKTESKDRFKSIFSFGIGIGQLHCGRCISVGIIYFGYQIVGCSFQLVFFVVHSVLV